MRRSEAITELGRRANALQMRGAAAAYLFGSTARDEAGPGSDLDLFIDIEPGRMFSLFDLVGMKLFLEDELRVKVDLATRGGLHPLLRADIESSAIRVV